MSLITEATTTFGVKAAAFLSAIGAAGVAVAAPTMIEPMVPYVGIPQSMYLVAIVGTMIGVFILPDADTNRVSPPDNVPTMRRGLMLLLRVGALGGLVLIYAVVASWIVQVLGVWFPKIAGGPQLPLVGLSGVLIRRMLPRYLQVVERATDWVGGKRQ